VTYVTPNYQKIVGGSAAQAHSWPSIALVNFTYKATIELNGSSYNISQSYSCGGFLVDKTTVLTAAHCIVKQISYTNPLTGQTNLYTVVPNQFYQNYGASFTIYLGLQDTTKLTATGVVKASAIDAFSHPDYDEKSFLNDIGIFKLASPVELSSFIQVACLPVFKSSSYPSVNRPSYAAGWGTLSSGGSAPSSLNDVQLTVYSSNKCLNVETDAIKNWNSQVCAGDLSGQKDTCEGDSGGPLFITDMVGNETRFVSVGITSYGVECATLPA
jgi:secreted trypsin-like serine protease